MSTTINGAIAWNCRAKIGVGSLPDRCADLAHSFGALVGTHDLIDQTEGINQARDRDTQDNPKRDFLPDAISRVGRETKVMKLFFGCGCRSGSGRWSRDGRSRHRSDVRLGRVLRRQTSGQCQKRQCEGHEPNESPTSHDPYLQVQGLSHPRRITVVRCLKLHRDCCRACSASTVASVKVVMVGERADRTKIDAAAGLRSYIAAGDRTSLGAEIGTLTVGSTSLTDPGPTFGWRFETSKPTAPLYPAIKHDHHPPGKGLASNFHHKLTGDIQ